MKRQNHTPKKYCFISNTEESYLTEYLSLNRLDIRKDFSFKKLDLNSLIEYMPDIIIIDLYFTDKNYHKLAKLIQNALPNTNIYILSPEYADYNGLMQSLNNPNHFYSNFSLDILNHINSKINNGFIGGSKFSEAS